MDDEGIEIRSFRAVFDLERRIYRVDRVRLNPAGVPLRGVVYVLAVALTTLVAQRLPLLEAPLRLMPWWFTEVGGPCALGSLLAMLRIDGRPFHLFAHAALTLSLRRRRRRAGLLPSRGLGGRWAPGCLLMLPDGSRPGALRFRGPGAVRFAPGHCVRAVVDPPGSGGRRWLRLWPPGRARSGHVISARPDRARLVLLERGATLTVRAGG